jgi:hypothetical protein
MSLSINPQEREHQREWSISIRAFALLLFAIVGGAILRSAVATRLDSFHLDEGYHIAAGVSYVRHWDFRINPEHPPLMKLWVGSFVAATGFHLSPFREFHDKPDERDFTETDVFLHNDPDSVQRRSRMAMFALNSMLMVVLAFTLRRVFGAFVALGAILFLAIDPTVAAHLPIALTDLPVSLLSASAVVLGASAFRNWRWADLAACSAVLGLALGTKHSALVFAVLVALVGVSLAAFGPSCRAGDTRLKRFAKVGAVLAGALVVLWGIYFFRFTESSERREMFNRPLADKIADLDSPVFRITLTGMAKTHVLPRAYIWGLADTIRAGVEGRFGTRVFFGRAYYDKGPKYFFPGVMAVKIPIGLSLLALTGLFLFIRGRMSGEWRIPLALVVTAALWFLAVLTRGATYAGIRHALPAVVLVSVLGGVAIHAAAFSNAKPLKLIVAIGLVGAGVAALPVIRPWEYYNEIIGGKNKAYLYFNDEGVDQSQRMKEMARYYHEVLEPAGEVPFIQYGVYIPELMGRGLDWVGRDRKRDEVRLEGPTFSGTILIGAMFLSKRYGFDLPALREATPTARFGNLFVFRGSFVVPGLLAEDRYWTALSKLYAEKPDISAGEELLRQSAALDPNAFYVNIHLGSVCLRRGSREDALVAYRAALEHAPEGVFRRQIEEQIRRVSVEPLNQIPELRDPIFE